MMKFEKPSYEELILRVRDLKQQIAKFENIDGAFGQNQIELEAIFKKAPLVMLIVDGDRQVCRLNDAAVAMSRRMAKSSIGLRGGEVLRCANAFDDPRGCGFGTACENCVVRNTVLDTFNTGRNHHAVEAPIPYATENGIVDMWVLVSTTLLKLPQGLRVLVCLEDITDRNQAEENLKKLNNDLVIRNKIANLFLTSSDEEVFSGILDLLLDAFESRFGYFGYIDDRGDLVCPSMTRDIWDRCNIPEKSIVFPRDCWGGIWGESLKSKSSRFKNQNLNLPEKHVPLYNALAVPLLTGKEPVGQIAIGNKAAGYTPEDRMQLESIAEFIAPILKIYLAKDHAELSLKAHAKELEEKNIALNVFLENREEEKNKITESILRNFERLVFPYYEKLKNSNSREETSTILNIVETNTHASLSPLEKPFSSAYRTFTPAEIQVADLIKAGKSSKEVAAVLNISPRSVFFHRNNIRKKLNIQNTKANLRTFLNSLS